MRGAGRTTHLGTGITPAENRKLGATVDLTRVASRHFFGKH